MHQREIKKRKLDGNKDRVCFSVFTTCVKTTGDAVLVGRDSKQCSPCEFDYSSSAGTIPELSPQSDAERNINSTTGDGVIDDLTTQSNLGEVTYLGPDYFKDFQNKLIEFYRDEYSNVPVSPVNEEYVVPLIEIYVKPRLHRLMAVDTQHLIDDFTKKPVLNYEQLFCQTMDKINHNIYVTSSAGMGKTVLCKHICMTWCQAHNQDESTNKLFKPEDVHALKQFEFLFYISLSDVHRSLCHLDQIIKSFIEDYLPNISDLQLLQILDERHCLIVLDAFDEWIHPHQCDRRKTEHDIPHRKFRKNWTIMTTTRSWKYDMMKITLNKVDIHIELNELEESSSNELVQNAINSLNMRFKTGKKAEEFYRSTIQFKHLEIRNIPYLNLYCVCLWYDGRDKDIRNSKGDIYCNILEFIIFRGTQKLQLQQDPKPKESRIMITKRMEDTEFASTPQESSTIPKCMEDKELCVKHWSLLMKIGELALNAFIGSKDDQIDHELASKYLKSAELQFCLKLGLLLQNKKYGPPISKRKSVVSFQHRSIYEYLAALYMHSTSRDPSSVSHTLKNIYHLYFG